jgi:hypothetical protein
VEEIQYSPSSSQYFLFLVSFLVSFSSFICLSFFLFSCATVLIGHSFGGKVVMSMIKQFSGLGRLPVPVTVWVLDTLPGHVRAGGPARQDHPLDLIQALKKYPVPTTNRNEIISFLTQAGFSLPVARWMSTNLK